MRLKKEMKAKNWTMKYKLKAERTPTIGLKIVGTICLKHITEKNEPVRIE